MKIVGWTVESSKKYKCLKSMLCAQSLIPYSIITRIGRNTRWKTWVKVLSRDLKIPKFQLRLNIIQSTNKSTNTTLAFSFYVSDKLHIHLSFLNNSNYWRSCSGGRSWRGGVVNEWYDLLWKMRVWADSRKRRVWDFQCCWRGYVNWLTPKV